MLEEMFDYVVLDLVAGCTARLVGGFFFLMFISKI